MKTGVQAIAAERKRQIKVKGWSAKHDDQHTTGSLAVIAAIVACDWTGAIVNDPLGRCDRCTGRDSWGILKRHGVHGKKPDQLHLIAVAGALLAAEYDRVQRLLRAEKVTKP